MDEDVRVGDADREQAISALEGHCRAGRLGMDELLERSAAAYAARTRAVLAALTGDLPDETGTADEPQKRGWRDPAWRLHVTLTVLVNAAVTGLWLVTRTARQRRPTRAPATGGRCGSLSPAKAAAPLTYRGGAGGRPGWPPPRPRPATLRR